MKEYIDISSEVLDFIQKSPTAFHAVKTAQDYLIENGFKALLESEKWTLTQGEKYFVKRNGSSIIAFTYPKNDFNGFSIVASHSDSPTFKLKENHIEKVENNYTKLNTEPYGGMIMSSWQDRALSVAGRVQIEQNGQIKSVLVNIEKDLLIIPNLAIHMQRDINQGHKFNPQVDMLPLCGDENCDILEIVAKEYSVEKSAILSHDLYLYPREKGRIIGEKPAFITSPRLDDLQCVYTSLKALVNSNNENNISVSAIFDNEEVGSSTKQGAGSTFLFDTLKRISLISKKDEEDYRIALSNSMMVSADNAHAVHPNFASMTDTSNRNYLNKGIVIKFNSNQKYTTDSVSASMFKLICKKADVPVQVFHNRSDMPGGSTLGNISNTRVSLNTVDIGIPQLAMHSAVETAGVKDTLYAYKAMREFFCTTFCVKGDSIMVEDK